MKYEKLLSRGKIGQLELRNRVVMPPMGTSLASYTGEATDEIIRYYEERAKGGCGLIITEITRIDEETGIGMPGQLSLSAPRYIRKLMQLVDAVHQYDTKIFAQLHHPGREVSSRLLNGLQPVAPSPIACKVTKELPRELTTAECDELVQKFVMGAYYAKIAGFDGVELHAAHGYLLNQFLSPYTNKRTDKYGGDYFNRLNFVVSIIKGIQSLCGPTFPISVRISADEFTEGGLTIEDSIKIARSLESFGIAAINVSAGTYESGYSIIEPQLLPQGWKQHLAKRIKENVSIPVIAVNNVKEPAFAEELLENEVSDFVGIGRAQLADSAWVNKARDGKEELIHKCIGCLHCIQIVNTLRPIACTVNPILGRELRYADDNLVKDGAGRKVVVIGGGPSGMHAAFVLGKRDYDVTLIEKSGSLGGLVKTAEVPPGKEFLGEFIKTQAAELASVNVEVMLNTEATVDLVKGMNPYGVVLAVGGHAIVPRGIAGIDQDHVTIADDVLMERTKLKGRNIAIIGGGVTGLETAEVLSHDNQVTVYEMQGDVGTTLYGSLKALLLMNLQKAGVKIVTNRRLTEISKDKITLMESDTAFTEEVTADAVVLALGVASEKETVSKFTDAFSKVMVVGDAKKPAQIVDAMKAANDQAFVF